MKEESSILAETRRCVEVVDGGRGVLVAELSQQLLRSGRRFCFLFTDLANPTSNALYQRLGYQPVQDLIVMEFK